MSIWIVNYEVWPHSTGHGATADQEAVGERHQTTKVGADSFADAVKLAEIFIRGVESHLMVWQAPITSISRERRS